MHNIFIPVKRRGGVTVMEDRKAYPKKGSACWIKIACGIFKTIHYSLVHR